ncbi:hypothetical protein KR093_004657 [Drosophila rubida]|uniref:Uncharacterized protein n=1 Tax=Drosophila rubida TaxID=30044 RepID=A0AAD4K4E3_9MUSC|nr:hypothetical protein KR093_004657 [Drosophila rubida]
MSHLPLDARAILQHLNELGYRNISAEQLREFLKDLRKLIKHDERLATDSKEDYFSSLHKRDTVSSRAKLGNDSHDKGLERLSGGDKGKKSLEDALNLAIDLQHKLSLDTAKKPETSNCKRRSRSKTRNHAREVVRAASSDESDPKQGPSNATANRPKLRKSSRTRSTGRSSAAALGKSCALYHIFISSVFYLIIVRAQSKHKTKNPQSDPVALYHYYQSEWAHFRQQIPGNNAGIRHKPKDFK